MPRQSAEAQAEALEKPKDDEPDINAPEYRGLAGAAKYEKARKAWKERNPQGAKPAVTPTPKATPTMAPGMTISGVDKVHGNKKYKVEQASVDLPSQEPGESWESYKARLAEWRAKRAKEKE